MNLKDMLQNWRNGLDEDIGDTEEQIEKRRQQNKDAVKIRDDLDALIDFLHDNKLPAPVERAIETAVKWNPYCKNRKEQP